MPSYFLEGLKKQTSSMEVDNYLSNFNPDYLKPIEVQIAIKQYKRLKEKEQGCKPCNK